MTVGKNKKNTKSIKNMQDKNYVNVCISVQEEDFEIAYAILIDFEFIGMEEKFDEIILSFEEKNWNDKIKNNLEQSFNKLLPNAKISKIEILSEKNWNEEYEKNVEPAVISENIVITPEWKCKEFDCKYKIIINPKMSFGTGQHSTTKLMAIMLEKFMLEKSDKQKNIWIDAGTGTGVLAIIAAKLGAKKVYAFDNDDWAFENTKENAALNKVEKIIEVCKAEISNFDFPTADCILANMFLGLLISSFHLFHRSLIRSKGTLFVSGVLVYDREELLASAKQNNFILLEETQEMEWCCFRFEAK
jgi:ribosomal protein L11 methyltransferase